jgi:hypothetical protein
MSQPDFQPQLANYNSGMPNVSVGQGQADETQNSQYYGRPLSFTYYDNWHI